MSTVCWVIVPYAAIVVFIGGLVWRRRYDRFGWTTRSSQLYESVALRWGSPLFHGGILAVLAGHFGGLVIPASWTDAAGISERAYHLSAVFMGTVAGLCAVIGLSILLGRRLAVRPVRSATTRSDRVMYAVLAGVVLLGMTATLRAATGHGGDNYRRTVSPWFRSLFYLHPEPNLMAPVPLTLRLHVLAAFVLLACWPFTRLVHAFSAPVGYLTRPYLVYRSQDARAGRRPSPRNWTSAQ